jgi:hypothetical protein
MSQEGVNVIAPHCSTHKLKIQDGATYTGITAAGSPNGSLLVSSGSGGYSFAGSTMPKLPGICAARLHRHVPQGILR